MTECKSSKNGSGEAVKVRDAFCEKLWVEKETGKFERSQTSDS